MRGSLDEREFVNQGIAVDNAFEDPLDGSVGDVYVLDHNNGRVEKFDGEGHFLLQFAIPGGESIAVGPTGTVYVGEAGAVQEYTPVGEKLGEPVKLEGAGGVTGLALTGSGEIYATEAQFSAGNGEKSPARRYSATGEPRGVVVSELEGSARAVALSAAGEVFINQKPPTGGTQQIRGFSPAGVQVIAFATATGEERRGLAFGEQSGALYTIVGNGVSMLVPPAPGPIVRGESADDLEPTAALVHAVIEPDAPKTCGETHYHVDYGTTTGYGLTAPLSEGLLAASFGEDRVEVPLAGLTARTEYHYRVVAFDECEVEKGVEKTYTTEGEDEKFTTLPPVLIEDVFVTDVRSTSATLHATVNPLGSATEYRFVWGPCEGGGECSVPVPDEAIGSGGTGVEVERHLQGLTAGQGYRYHVVAGNSLGVVVGEGHSFTTEIGGEAGLPDGREWELVSPPDKNGALLRTTGEDNFTQAATDGHAIIYGATAPTEGNPQGNGEATQILAQRTTSGWSSTDLQVAQAAPAGVQGGVAYEAFSSDLSSGLLQPEGNFEPALSKAAVEKTPYLRDSATAAFTPLVTATNDTTEPFVPFGVGEGEECESGYCAPQFDDASPDLTHIVLESQVALLQGAPTVGLYEWAAGKLALVSVPPPNSPELNGNPRLGYENEVLVHAVSDDGSRVFWTEQALSGAGLLFMRDMARGETIEIGSGGEQFQGASADGSLVFYSGKECEVRAGETGGLECRPVDGQNGKPLEDGTVLATSEDGKWVYFQQQENIYARHNTEPAKLVASNIGDIKPSTAPPLIPQEDPWRASPNGEWFAFMSGSPLTGYDNHDAATGQADMEVYLYGAAAGRLVCASCDPTGARPRGAIANNLALARYGVTWEPNRGIAATIPDWVSFTNLDAIYDPRFLLDSGRLFFNAVGGLVPRDVNGQVDAYQFEPPGVGSCTIATQTGTTLYSPSAGGCVGLISSGESVEESVFQDASESGGDVFFLSSSRLSSEDIDGSLSLWDARVCSGVSLCLSVGSVGLPACDTEASCKASPSPQPAIFGAPSSATFVGSGNPVSPPSISAGVMGKRVRCRAGFRKGRGGRCVRKKSGRKKKARAGRARNDGGARR